MKLLVIKELNIVNFGNISNKKISFSDGFNVIAGENESGKSTILSFIRFIFYGVSSRKSEIKKYEPLLGGKISGTATVVFDGCEYEIIRDLNLTKAKQVRVINKSTSEEADRDFCAAVGENFLKMNEESFINTYFIGQLSAKITGGNDEILNKLSNLSSSGDEDISYNEIIGEIDEQIADLTSPRRKNAVILSLEKEIDDANSKIYRIKIQNEQKKELEAELARTEKELKEAKDEKNALTESINSARVLEIRKRLADEKNNIVRLKTSIEADKAKLYKIVPDKLFENIDKEKEAEFLKEPETDFDKSIQKLDDEYKKISLMRNIICILGAILTVLLCFINPFFFSIGILIIAFLCFLHKKSKNIIEKRDEFKKCKNEHESMKKEYLKRFESESKEEYLSKKAKYKEYENEKRILLEKIKTQTENLEILVKMHENTENDALTNYKNIDTIKVADYNLNVNIEEANEKIKKLDSEILLKTEKIHRLKFETEKDESFVEAQEKLEAAKTALAKAKERYEILETAKNYINMAFNELKSSFAPSLSENTSEIFEKLTEKKYSGVLINEKFLAKIKMGNSYEDAGFLSSGALDQLYFSMRMGIINTLKQDNEEYPVILDDAFAFYDDTRLKAVLDFLTEYSKHSQIVLSSCHMREADYLGKKANIINL